MTHWIRKAIAAALLACAAGLSLAGAETVKLKALTPAEAAVPAWPANSVIYTLYPSIFSAKGNFAGVTAQLPRLKALGVTDVWVMPVTPIGHAFNGHPGVDSPYAVHDYLAINPAYGTPADLKTLVGTAHKLGLRVILDEVLNHTAWDNALLTQHPEWYVHSDAAKTNPATIQQAFNFSDVAQLDYASLQLRTYIISMLQSWVTRYGVDGFRFDTADDPDGPQRMIPADFWQQLGTQLRRTKPNVLLLGECQTPDLALKPFSLDYAWRMVDPLKAASNGGNAAQVETTWKSQVADFPVGMKHLSLQDDWDYPRDVNTFGGAAGAQAVAVFNFTNTGIPLIYNGMEVGNAAQASNPHAPIPWASGDPRFPQFYRSLIALRRQNPALQQGAMTWLTNSAPSQVLTYTRSGGGAQFLVEINLSATPAQGTVQAPAGAAWVPVSLAGIVASKAHVAPPRIVLQPKEFVIFKRRTAPLSSAR